MDEPQPAVVSIRAVETADLPIFFAQHQNAEALHMAAFTPPDPANAAALIGHWQRLMHDPHIVFLTIVANGAVAGTVLCFDMFDQRQVGYWLGRDFWGKGIATSALKLLLALLPERPLYGRTAFDNIGSQRVLEKCGFRRWGTDRGYANARGAQIEEFIFRLE
jgi:RimJ/RimL family protein N-acetyltransferase